MNHYSLVYVIEQKELPDGFLLIKGQNMAFSSTFWRLYARKDCKQWCFSTITTQLKINEKPKARNQSHGGFGETQTGKMTKTASNFISLSREIHFKWPKIV